MPVQYESVLAEHKAVRTSAGFFDVTHLGRFELRGPGAYHALQRLLCNNLDLIEPGRSQYSMMLNDDGGVIDDLIVWWWDPELFWVLPNAANHPRVMEVFASQPDCTVVDLQKTTVMVALQGPEAPTVFEEVLGESPRRFRTLKLDWHGEELSTAGTGYTGERGGEICAPPDAGVKLVESLAEAGVTPCGLGARDTLRLEAGLALWGEDIDETTTPLEAGLDFAVDFNHEFVGREALLQQREAGLQRRLAGFVLEGKGIPRHGYQVRTPQGGEGTVTSGNLSPMLGRGIGLAYVSPPPEAEGGPVEVEIRSRWVPGRFAKPPFHRA